MKLQECLSEENLCLFVRHQFSSAFACLIDFYFLIIEFMCLKYFQIYLLCSFWWALPRVAAPILNLLIDCCSGPSFVTSHKLCFTTNIPNTSAEAFIRVLGFPSDTHTFINSAEESLSYVVFMAFITFVDKREREKWLKWNDIFIPGMWMCK